MSDPDLPRRTEPRQDTRHRLQTPARTPGGRGGGTAIAFIVGGFLVLVAVIAFFVLTGRAPAPEVPTADVEVDIQAPELPSVPTPDMPESPAPAAPPSTGAAG
jgi:hypothetical protein